MERKTRHRKHIGKHAGADAASMDPLDDSSRKRSEDNILEYLEKRLKGLPSNWKNWCVRNLSGILLIIGFSILVYGGPLSLMVMVLCIQLKVFQEIITVGDQHHNFYDVPGFRAFCWYFIVTANYFAFGETRKDCFVNFAEHVTVRFLARYHMIISLTLYLLGFISFIFFLDEKRYRQQFIMFGWIHLTLLLVIPHTYFALQNLFDGAVWVIVPIALVTCNDIVAYTCGFFFGRRQLLKLSPNKTWEGFVGGGIVTVALGWFLSGYLSQFPNLVCPTELGRDTACDTSPTFFPTEYEMPTFLQSSVRMAGIGGASFRAIPFQLHCLVFSLFSALVAPFGGFFASGFKRAFNVKDFGSVIPGHGGVLDRCDCQILMVAFVHVYMSTFIRDSFVDKLPR